MQETRKQTCSRARMRKENRSRLQHDLEENILSRLPVKTIVRFMSVCKSWYSLFLNPYFIQIHNKNSTNNSSLLLMRRYVRDEVVVMDSCSSVVCSRLLIQRHLGSLIPRDGCRNIVGSCNGIVCIHGLIHIHDHLNSCFRERAYKDYICLWNPTLRITKFVETNDYRISDERMFIGFGFDSHSNDYKVLRFYKSDVGAYQQVQIYSLSSDSWRTVEGAAAPPNIKDFFMRSHYHSRESGVYVNQTHHWVVCHRKGEPKPSYNAAIILSFDMREEAFKETIVPTECMEEEHMSMILFNYNECLAMLTFIQRRPLGEFDFHDIWVMKDYGLPESWTKLCKIDKRTLVPRTWAMRFRGFTETQDGLIFSDEERDQPIVFDTSWTEVKNQMIFKDAMEVMDFRESLELLNSKNLVRYE